MPINTKKIKVAIADDHLMVLKGVQHMLATCNHIELCGAFSNGEDLLKNIATISPDVLLLDIQLPGIQGDEIAARISKQYPDVRILVITNLAQSAYVHKMMEKGASGYLLKNTDINTLVAAIDAIYKGQQFIDPSLKETLLQDMLDAKKKAQPPIFSRRELDILQYIANEFTSQEIAEKLFISSRTVESIRLNLLAKMDVKNVAGLIRKAIQLNLIHV